MRNLGIDWQKRQREEEDEEIHVEEEKMLRPKYSRSTGGPDGVGEETEGEGNHESWHFGCANSQTQPS